LPPAAADPALAARVRAPVPPEDDPARVVIPPTDVGAEPALSLAGAIALALENNPRLAAVTAEVARAGGLEEVAYAPFLPTLGLLTRYVATSNNL
jgi:outer membrane protein TolC